MSSLNSSRRRFLRGGAAAATTLTLGGLSGCLEQFTGSESRVETVPAGVQFVVDLNATALFEDEAMRDGVNERLAEIESEAAPESVQAALDDASEETDLDPEAVSEVLMFGVYEGDDETGMLLWADWTEEELVDAVEQDGAELSEDEYEGRTVYVDESSMSPTWLAVLEEEGTYAIGRPDQVREVVDVRRDEADALNGALREGFEAAEGDHARFAFEVVDDMVPNPDSSELNTEAFRNVTHAYGSLYESGEDRGVAVNFAADSEEDARDVHDVADGALTLAEQDVDTESGGEQAERLLAILEATEVERDGATVTVRHERPAEDFAGPVVALVMTFVLGVGSSSQMGSGSGSARQTPQVSFSFDYVEHEDGRGELTITHNAGDTVPADELLIDGRGFELVEGVDMTDRGQWAGTASNGDVRAGDAVTVGVRSDATIHVLWQSEDQRAILAQWEGPDA